eukprot:scaffold1389_cov107-Isochrysis_galbana.AAC.2
MLAHRPRLSPGPELEGGAAGELVVGHPQPLQLGQGVNVLQRPPQNRQPGAADPVLRELQVSERREGAGAVGAGGGAGQDETRTVTQPVAGQPQSPEVWQHAPAIGAKAVEQGSHALVAKGIAMQCQTGEAVERAKGEEVAQHSAVGLVQALAVPRDVGGAGKLGRGGAGLVAQSAHGKVLVAKSAQAGPELLVHLVAGGAERNGALGTKRVQDPPSPEDRVQQVVRQVEQLAAGAEADGRERLGPQAVRRAEAGGQAGGAGRGRHLLRAKGGRHRPRARAPGAHPAERAEWR